jgi:hypothetical protein
MFHTLTCLPKPGVRQIFSYFYNVRTLNNVISYSMQPEYHILDMDRCLQSQKHAIINKNASCFSVSRFQTFGVGVESRQWTPNAENVNSAAPFN